MGRFATGWRCQRFANPENENYIYASPDDAMTFEIRPTFFHGYRLLNIGRESLSWRLPSGREVTFDKAAIDAYRYSITGIRGYAFWIGLKYLIEVRGQDQQIIRVQFISLYGMNGKKLRQKFVDIVSALHQRYFNDIALHYLSLLHNELSFSLCGVGLSPVGIADRQLGEIDWSWVGIKSYSHYFAVYDIRRPENYRGFEYRIEWNAAILYAVLHHAVRPKQLSGHGFAAG